MNYNIKNKRITIGIILVITSLLYVILSGSISTIQKNIVHSNYDSIQIGQGDKLVQQVVLDENRPSVLLLPFTEDSYYKNMQLNYSIVDSNRNLISEDKITLKEWNGNRIIEEGIYHSGYSIALPDNLEGTISVRLTVEYAESNSTITLRTGSTMNQLNVLEMNDGKQSKPLAIKVLYNDYNWGKILKTIITAIIAYGVFLLVGNKPVRNFVIISTSFGIMFIFNNPFFEATDEIFHFSKAYDISLGNLLSTKQDDTIGVNLPANFEDMPRPNEVEISYGMLGANERYDESKVDAWKEFQFSKDMKYIEQPTTAVYSPIPYIPQVIGIQLANIFGLKAFYSIVFARLLNLITYILLTALAIRMMPRLKNTLSFLACFPLFVSLAASFSADSILMGLNFLFIAWMLKILMQAKEDTLTIKQFIVPTILLVLIVLCKFTYWPLSLLIVAFVGRKLFVTKLQGVFSFILLSGLPAIILVVWNLFIMGYVGTISSNENVDAIEQLKFMLSHPIKAVEAFFSTFEWGMTHWVLMANQVGWVTHLLTGTAIISIVGLVLTLIFDHIEDEWRLRRFDYSVFIVSIIGTVFLVMLSLYLTWTDVGLDFISGLQGRYFLPAIPLILFIFNEKLNVKEYSNINANKSSKLAAIILLYANLFMIGNFY